MSENEDSKLWLTGLVLGAANVIHGRTGLSSLIHMNVYDGISGQFEIFGIKSEANPNGEPLVETEDYRLYVAKLPSGQFGLMKISINNNLSEVLENEISLLEKAQSVSDEIDQKYDSLTTDQPYYGASFPKIVERIDAGGRAGMFLGYNQCIQSYKQLVPLSAITANVRVDLKTTQWVLGKLLKVISFFHGWRMHCGVKLINTSNVLVETNLHGVFVLDFSRATTEPTDQDYVNDIVGAGKIAWQISGGTDKNDPPHDPEIMSKENYVEYVKFIRRLMEGRSSAAYEEFMAIYDLSDKIWPKVPKFDGNGTKRQFHEFKTYPK